MGNGKRETGNEHEYKLRFTALAGERFFRYLINAPVFSLKEWAGIPFEIPAVKALGIIQVHQVLPCKLCTALHG